MQAPTENRIETDNRGFPFIFLSAIEVRSLSLTASLDRYGKSLFLLRNFSVWSEV